MASRTFSAGASAPSILDLTAGANAGSGGVAVEYGFAVRILGRSDTRLHVGILDEVRGPAATAGPAIMATIMVAINAVMNPFKGVLPSLEGDEPPRVARRSIEHPSRADGRVPGRIIA